MSPESRRCGGTRSDASGLTFGDRSSPSPNPRRFATRQDQMPPPSRDHSAWATFPTIRARSLRDHDRPQHAAVQTGS